MNSGIYTITNTCNNKVYVGYAKSLDRRRTDHFWKLRHNCHANAHLQAAYNKYGYSKIVFEVLEYSEICYLPSLEHYWCMLLNSHNCEFGYNIQPTNPMGDVLTHSLETRQKISLKLKGKKLSDQHKSKLDATRLGRLCSMNTRAKIAGSNSGKKRTTEMIQRRLNSIANGIHSKVICQYDTDYNLVQEWPSCAEASRELQISVYSLRRCIGKGKPYSGFVWTLKTHNYEIRTS